MRSLLYIIAAYFSNRLDIWFPGLFCRKFNTHFTYSGRYFNIVVVN